MPEDEPTPDEEDGYISAPSMWQYSVVLGGKWVGSTLSGESAEGLLRAAMEVGGFYPNCWYVDDHGGYTLITDLACGA